MKVGVGGKVRSVSHREGERYPWCDLPAVKPLNGAVHQCGRNVVEEEIQGQRHGIDHALSTERDHLDAQVDRRAADGRRERKQSDPVFENGGGGVFVAIHQETNQRLTRAWLAFRCVFKTQDDLQMDHFAGSQVGVVLRRADAAGGEDGPRLHFNVVFHTVVETQAEDLGDGQQRT